MLKLLKLIFLLALSALALVMCIGKITQTKEYCGVVITKDAYPSYASKHGNYQGVENSMVVKFKDIGYRTMDVSTNTYYNYKAGDYICFDLQINQYEDTYSAWYLIPIFISSFSILLCLVMIVAYLIKD